MIVFIVAILSGAGLFVAYGLLFMHATRPTPACGSCALASACASKGRPGILAQRPRVDRADGCPDGASTL